MQPTYVIGHRNPDTDAICSAIGYADLLTRTRMPEAVPARCGEVDSRTAWVLERAGLPAPRLLPDVWLRIGDICRRNVSKATSNETFLDVYQRMRESDHRSIPVVDIAGRIHGMASLLDLLALLLPGGEIKSEARTVRTTLANVVRALGGEVLSWDVDLDLENDFIMMVAASSTELVTRRIGELPTERLLLIAGDRPEVHRSALERGVGALVVTAGHLLNSELLEVAERTGVPVLFSAHDTASSTQLIRCSRRIDEAVSSDFASFAPEDRVDQVAEQVGKMHQALFPVVDRLEGHLVGVFSMSDLVNPVRPRLVLVDHNEFSQAVPGADEAEIVEVLDHHRLSGNLVSREPIQFINKPVGSTSTIVARAFRTRDIDPSRAIATCLCAGIVSDTLNLTSPTSTDVDREMLAWLGQIADLDVDKFTSEFFAAGSALRGNSAQDAINSDRKEFSDGGWRLSISQIEELGLEQFWQRREELQTEIDRIRAEEKFDAVFALITDLSCNDSVLLVSAQQSLLENIEYSEPEPGAYELPGVVSRKKQLFPWVTRMVAQAGLPGPASQV